MHTKKTSKCEIEYLEYALDHASQAAKKILEEHKATPIAVLGRYAGAYTHIRKVDWWDTDLCGGPIVEQATLLYPLPSLQEMQYILISVCR